MSRILSLFILTIFALANVTFAAVDPNDPAVKAQREAELKADLERIEKEKAAVQKTLDATRQEGASLQRDVNILNAEIKKAELSIQEKNLRISKLGDGIEDRQKTVAELESKIDQNKDSLGQLMRKTNYLDDYSLAEFVLAGKSLSDFFVDADDFSAIKKEINGSFEMIRQAKGEVEEEKSLLEREQIAEIDTKKSLEADKNTVSRKQGEKSNLLSINKQTAKTYETVIAEKERQAQAIRDALFSLRDAQGISFDQALEYATAASKATGVRTAFILAILKQESNLGQNTGSCVITDLKSGQTKGVSSGKIFDNGIHPTRDLPILQTILSNLGKDPLQTRVSCPFSVGYGGAMGPSQFIPSTWTSYIPRLTQAFGSYPDPWNPRHAIMGTALLTKDLGASAGGYTAERTAALKYYAGGNWSLPGNAFYGDQVMQHAATMQEQIDFLKEVEG